MSIDLYVKYNISTIYALYINSIYYQLSTSIHVY